MVSHIPSPLSSYPDEESYRGKYQLYLVSKNKIGLGIDVEPKWGFLL